MGKKSKGKTSAALRANLKPLKDDETNPMMLSSGASPMEGEGDDWQKVENMLDQLGPAEIHPASLTSGFMSQEDLSILGAVGLAGVDELPSLTPAFNGEDSAPSEQQMLERLDPAKEESPPGAPEVAPVFAHQSEGNMEEAALPYQEELQRQQFLATDEIPQKEQELIEKLRLMTIKSNQEEREVQTLKADLDSKEADLKVLEKRIQVQEELNQECERLRQQFAECRVSKQAATKEARGCKHQLEKVTQELENLSVRHKAMEAKMENLAEVNVKLEKETAEAAEELKMVQAQGESKLEFLRQKSEKEVADLTEDFQARDQPWEANSQKQLIEKLEAQLHRAEDVKAEMKSAYEMSLKLTDGEKQNLMGQLQIAKLDIESLRKSSAETQVQLRQFQALLNTERTTGKNLTEMHQTMVMHKEQAEKEIGELKGEIQRLQSVLSQRTQVPFKRKISPGEDAEEAKKANLAQMESVIRQDLSLPPPSTGELEKSSAPGHQGLPLETESSRSPHPLHQGVSQENPQIITIRNDPTPVLEGPRSQVTGAQTGRPQGAEAARPEWPVRDVPGHPKFDSRAALSQVVTVPINALLMEPSQLADSYLYVTALKNQVNHNFRLLEHMVPQLRESTINWDQHGPDRDLLVRVARYLAIPRRPEELTATLQQLAESGAFMSDTVSNEIQRATARWILPDMTLGSPILPRIFDASARHFRRFAIRFLLVILTPAYHFHFTRMAVLGTHMEQGCAFFFGPRAGSSFPTSALHLLVTLSTAMATALDRPDKLGLPATNPAGILPVELDGAPSTDQLRLLQSQTGFKEDIILFINDLDHRHYMYNDVAGHIDKKEKPALKKLFQEDIKTSAPQVRRFYELVGVAQPAVHNPARQRGHQGGRRKFYSNY